MKASLIVLNKPQAITRGNEWGGGVFVWSSHEKLNYMIIKCLWNLWLYSTHKGNEKPTKSSRRTATNPQKIFVFYPAMLEKRTHRFGLRIFLSVSNIPSRIAFWIHGEKRISNEFEILLDEYLFTFQLHFTLCQRTEGIHISQIKNKYLNTVPTTQKPAFCWYFSWCL